MALLFFLCGAYAVSAQIILLREMAILFQGYELFFGTALAAWLAFTGWGSLRAVGPSSKTILAWRLILVSGAFPLSVLAVRFAKALLPFGSMPGFFWTCVLPPLFLGPPCFLLGSCFTLGVNLKEPGLDASKIYYWESQGGVAAGLGLTFFVISRWPLLAALTAGSFLLQAAALALFKKGWGRAVAAALATAAFAATALAPKIDDAARRGQFHGYTLLEQRETRYGHAASASLGSQKCFFQNGTLTALFGDPAFSEELAHWPMLAHKNPKTICLLGNGAIAYLEEILKYRPRAVHLIEPDSQSFELMGRLAARRNATADVHAQDPRSWLKSHPSSCDVIVHGAAEPSNAALNRLFTKEFFLAAKTGLRPGGILAFSLKASENYMSPQTAYLDAGVLKTLRSVFAYTRIIPGGKIAVLAGQGPLALETEVLAARYQKRGVKNQVIVPSYFPFALEEGRRSAMEARFVKLSRVSLNTDFAPISYLYAWRLWLSQVVSPKEMLGPIVAGAILCWILWKARRTKNLTAFDSAARNARDDWGGADASAAAAWLGAMGFFTMMFQTAVLLAFQSLSGALYWQMGLLFASSMTGLALGSALGAAYSKERAKGKIFVVLTLLSLALAALAALGLIKAGEINVVALGAVSAAVLLGANALAGATFAAAAAGAVAPATLYSAELWGSAAGAFLAGGIAIPLLGIQATFALSTIPLIAIWLQNFRIRLLKT